MPLWTLDNIWLGGDRQPRLEGVSLTIEPGVTAVVGYSGAGKTSLLNLLVGFERPDRRSRQGLVCHLQPGEHRLPLYWTPHDGGLWPHLTVRQHLEQVLADTAQHAANPQARVTHLLAAFDLIERAAAQPGTLSQGERQRLGVARCIAAEPAVMVMDEPMAHVDPARLGGYWQVIREHVEATGCSLVFATHDPQTVLAEARDVICMKAGRVIHQGDARMLYDKPPTAELAAYLGPFNWWEPIDEAATEGPHDHAAWPTGQDGSPCLRPERLEVLPDATGASGFVVRETRFCGSFGQMRICHEPTGQQRTVVHRPTASRFAAGDRVVLRVVAMAVLLVSALFSLTACGNEEPSLAVQEVRYWSVPPDGPRIPRPRSITFGPGDEMLVLDTVGRILIFNPDGSLNRTWTMPETEQGAPESAFYMTDGRIAVADTHYFRIVLFDQQGTVVGMFGSRGDEPGQFRFPISVVQDDEGYLYVAEFGGNDRVQKFTPDGEHVLTIGSHGSEPGQFQRPQCIAWFRPEPGTHELLDELPGGVLLVSDVEKGVIHIYSGNGQYLAVLGEQWFSRLGEVAADADQASEGAHRLGYPYGVAVGPDGSIYAAEWQEGRVSKFSLDGQLLGRFGSPGRGEGQLLTPWAVGVDSHDRIRIADTGNGRIVELVQ